MTIPVARPTRSTRSAGWVQVVLIADLSLGAGGVINVAVAEYGIRRPASHRTAGRPAIRATAKVPS